MARVSDTDVERVHDLLFRVLKLLPKSPWTIEEYGILQSTPRDLRDCRAALRRLIAVVEYRNEGDSGFDPDEDDPALVEARAALPGTGEDSDG